MDEVVLYNRFGQAVFRLCDDAFYDYRGQPRGFLVGRTVYDARGQHRGFYVNGVMRDRMGKVVGYTADARVPDLRLPECTIPPVPYKNLPAPEKPVSLPEREFRGGPPVWSIMQLANLLV
ncbi:hypothetical protein JXB37_04510 [candidate division WOR-3 bacterium]|nr:hypothetical protein [candidate division WOR-3 bacterium]